MKRRNMRIVDGMEWEGQDMIMEGCKNEVKLE
jgi:hypothetical protein